MIDVNKHILDLLYGHDCVIMPGIGGLILNYREGKYDAGTRQFFPPARQLSFNGLLTDDDGLLISNISEKEGLKYRQSKEIVLEHLGGLRENVRQNGHAVMDGIGKFSLSPEGKWIFDPSGEINFLDDSFGLRPVTAQPAAKELPARKSRAMKERTDRRTAAPAPVPQTVRWTVITAIPVVLFLLWGILFPASFQERYASYSGIITDLFIQDKNAAPDQPHHMTPNDPVLMPEKTIPPPAENKPEAGTDELAVNEEVPVAEEPGPDPAQEPAPEEPRIQYHVIGGVFRSQENADRYVEALAQLGYNSDMAGTNSRGFFRVSYDRFPTWDQAASFLETVKKKENPSAWILKY